jgi:hypothetical protein
MIAGFCHVESDDAAPEPPGLCQALIAALCLAVLCIAPARSAEWDPAAATNGLRMPDSLLTLRDMYPDLATRSARREFSREFQPRTSAFPAVSPEVPFHSSVVLDMRGDLPQSSVWQRMGDFRSDRGIRLLTVWQTAGSTIALHQKNGGASLQWTSHVMNRGGASRGLFDQLLSTVRGARAPVRTSAISAPAAPPSLAAHFAMP